MRLRVVGSSLSKIARELDVQPTTVTAVSQGLRRSRRIEDKIAQTLSTSAAKLWPDRYPYGVDETSTPTQPEDSSPMTSA
jgi:lambda repressor-like predicted transcriptional regulator